MAIMELTMMMGYTPKNLKSYYLNYYYNYYKVDLSITEEFLDAVHAVLAKYGTRLEEKDNIPINFVEDTIEFKSHHNSRSLLSHRSMLKMFKLQSIILTMKM